MSERRRRHDEILGASVVVTGWSPERRDEVTEVLTLLSPEPVDLDEVQVPYLVLEKTTVKKAERARDLIREAGGIVELRDEWVTRDTAPPAAERPTCPFCGSGATQPYSHAGPGARKRMKCTTCGRAFQVARSR
jgi:hypothetical protein